MAEFFRRTPTRQDKIQILRFEPHRNATYRNWILERKWTKSMKGSKKAIPNKPRQIENILDGRIVNLSNLQLTQSETNLLRKGLNFCPTPPPPRIDDINKDILVCPQINSQRISHPGEHRRNNGQPRLSTINTSAVEPKRAEYTV